MIKRIITFVVCLALCVSCIAVGVVNQKAKDSSVEAAANGAIGGIGSNASVDNVSATTPGLSDANAVGAPAGAGTLTDKTDTSGFEATEDDGIVKNGNTYYLTKDIAVDEAADIDVLANALASADTVVFDGNGYTITTSKYLFSEITNCTIKNLTVAGDITVSAVDDGMKNGGYYYLGIIANFATGTVKFDNVNVTANLTYGVNDTAIIGAGTFVGTIEKAKSDLTIERSAYGGTFSVTNAGLRFGVGGLIGRAVGNSSTVDIDNCTVSGNLTGTYQPGGLISLADGTEKVTIENSKFTGTLQSTKNTSVTALLGGFVGEKMTTELEIKNCLSSGDISAEGCSKDVLMGGFIGQSSKETPTTITSCLSSGDLSAEGCSQKVLMGGFIGQNSQATPTTITSCLSTADLSTEKCTNKVNMGGFVGAAYNGSLTIDGAKFTGSLVANHTATAAECAVGGVIGYCGTDSVTYDFKNLDVQSTISVTTSTTVSSGVGGIAGIGYNTCAIKVENCDVACNITSSGAEHVGGAFGLLHASAVTVTGDSDISGTINFNKGASGGRTFATDKYINGCGGVAGSLTHGSSRITINADTTVSTTINYNAEQIANVYLGTGGVVGVLNKGTLDVIGSEIVDNISVTAGGDNNACGGVVGYCSLGTTMNITTDTTTAERATLSGTVTTTVGYAVGGLIGRMNYGSGSATVNVDGLDVLSSFSLTGNKYVSGLVGYMNVASDLSFRNIDFAGSVETTISSTNGIGLICQVNAATSITFENVNLGVYNETTGEIEGEFKYKKITAVGGFLANLPRAITNGVTIRNCVNYLDLGDANATYASGFIGAANDSKSEMTITMENCINFGELQASTKTDAFIAAQGDVPEVTIKNCANLAGDMYAIDANGAKTTGDTFTVSEGTATGNSVVFSTAVNKTLYDIVVDVLGEENVEFGAIITLSDYLDSTKGAGKYISEFTHEAFDTYLEANRETNTKLADITALYMTATFPEGTGLEADGDNYVANIYLGGNLYTTTYIARAFIKVGGVYTYSK